MTIPQVIARMRKLEAELPPGDGVRWFTHLYLAVTENVQKALRPKAFADPRFLGRLDVVFAGLFFDACERPPKAWAPLFEARAAKDVAPIQFALAGMNAHINRDLPVALVRTAAELGVDLEHAAAEHGDFTKVNALLAATEAAVKKEFATGVLRLADEVLAKVDDRIAMWDVGRAREAAWVQGQVLWKLRSLPPLEAAYLDTLDRTVGFAGRGLLVPI